MKKTFVWFLMMAAMVVITASSVAMAVTIEDCVVHYTFDGTSGTSYADSSLNLMDAPFYRPVYYTELPGLDASKVTAGSTAGPFSDGTFGFGTRLIDSKDQDVLVRVPESTALPGTGDSFAVSFWASVDSWPTAGGLIASCNANDLQWSIGFGGAYGMAFWSGDADPSGTGTYFHADCSTLQANTYNHFVVQYEGTAGITNVYVNGAAVSDAPRSDGFWANERKGLTLGGRDVDIRNYSTPINDAHLDDFAIISGVVDATIVNNLKTNGASSLGTRRLAHYAMNETTGTQVTDSSANANNGALVSYDQTTMGAGVRDIYTASRTNGVFNNCVELASNENRDNGVERIVIPSADVMPVAGEAFTVSFWLKPDEVIASHYGWDTYGSILSWSNDDLGFSVAQGNESDGSLIVRRTDGSYTSTGNDRYGIYLGEGTETSPGLALDPTEFHHFVVKVNELGEIDSIYVDGVYAERQFENGIGITEEETAVIGCRFKDSVTPYGLDYGLCAYLDDLAVISGELTEEEILIARDEGIAALWASVPGDTNNDKIVDSVDAATVATNWGATDLTEGASVGDFNKDGVVNAADAAIMAANWGDHTTTESSGSVPEPGTFVLLLSVLLSVLAIRRR